MSETQTQTSSNNISFMLEICSELFSELSGPISIIPKIRWFTIPICCREIMVLRSESFFGSNERNSDLEEFGISKQDNLDPPGLERIWCICRIFMHSLSFSVIVKTAMHPEKCQIEWQNVMPKIDGFLL